MNDPPPFAAAWRGKRKKFPRPTALPAMARIKPIRLPQASPGAPRLRSLAISSDMPFHQRNRRAGPTWCGPGNGLPDPIFVSSDCH